MDDVGRTWLNALICVVIIGIMAFVSLCENSAVEFNDAKLKKLAAEDKRAARLERLMSNPSRFYSGNLISRSILIIILAVLFTIYYFEPIQLYLYKLFWGTNGGKAEYYTACGVSVLILLSLLSILISVFGINIPKKLCTSGKIGEKFILSASGFYSCWLAVFKPLEIINELLSKLILRIMGVKITNTADTVTEEEILLMVDAVNETGGIEESQAEMISNIFQFDDLEIKEVMTHRTDIVAVEENVPVSEAVKLAIEEGFSRIPVYTDNVDNICGVLFVKDLLGLMFTPDRLEMPVREFMREIMFVPESNLCRELFEDFTEQKMQISVAVDEYGGTAGIVTMEDLLEAIVGSIQDEYDDEDEEIKEISSGVFEILGKTGYDQVMETLGKTPDEESGYETIGAMVTNILGRIPDEDEFPTVEWENIKFSVIKVQDKMIEKIRAEIITNDNNNP